MYERMLDKSQAPDRERLFAYCEAAGALLRALDAHLAEEYGTQSVIRFPYGNQYGWGLDERLKNKHVCDLFAERGAFTMLLKLSKAQIERVYARLTPQARACCDDKYPCGDGGWLHMRVTTPELLEDAKTLLATRLRKERAVGQGRLVLHTPTPEMAEQVMAYRRACLESGETRVHGSGGLHHDEDYAAYLEKTQRRKTLDDGDSVPSTQYFAFVDGRLVGSLQLRHKLNDSLRAHGGHIGYEVHPGERRKGYAARMLALALKEAKRLGLARVLVTCDKDNVASARTIQKNGGVLEDEQPQPGGAPLQRYWITL